MQPSPSADTSSPLLPSVRFCIVTPFSAVTIVATKRHKKHKRENLFCAFLRLFVASCYAARGMRSGTGCFVATGAFTGFDKADLISRQLIEISANTSANARHDQI